MLGSNLQVQELLHVIDSKVAFFNKELRTDATLCYIYIYIYITIHYPTLIPRFQEGDVNVAFCVSLQLVGDG